MKLNLEKSLTFKAGLLAVGKTIKRAIGTVTIILLVRLLTKEEFGTYRQVLFIIGLIVTVIQFNFPKSLFYFVPKAKDLKERNEYISQSYFFLSLLGVFSYLLLYFFADFLGQKFNNPQLGILLKRYAPVVIFLAFSQNFFSTILISLDRHKYASYSYIFVGMPNAVGIILAALLGFSVLEIFTLSLVIVLIQYFILMIILKKLNVELFKLSSYQKIRDQLKYVFPLSIAMISNLLSVELDRLVISVYFTASTFAIYSVAAVQIPFVGNLLEGVRATIIPKISEYHSQNNINEIEYICNRATRKIALFIFPIFSFLFIYADKIITILYTDRFIEAVPVFKIYLLFILVKLSLCGAIIAGSGRTLIILKTTLLTLSLNLIMNFLLVRTLGVIGPAIATIGTRILHQFILIYWVKSRLSYNLKKLFPVGSLIKIFTIALFSSLLIYPASYLSIPKLIFVPLAGICFLTIYIFLLFKFQILLKSEKEIIRSFYYHVPLLSKQRANPK